MTVACGNWDKIYHSRLFVLWHKQFSVRFINKELETNSNLVDKTAQIRSRSFSGNSVSIKHHSGVQVIILKTNQRTFYYIVYRQVSCKQSTKVCRNKQEVKHVVSPKTDVHKVYKRKVEMEQHYVAQQPRMDREDNSRRFLFFGFNCSWNFKRHCRLAKQIEIGGSFSHSYRLRK